MVRVEADIVEKECFPFLLPGHPPGSGSLMSHPRPLPDHGEPLWDQPSGADRIVFAPLFPFALYLPSRGRVRILGLGLGFRIHLPLFPFPNLGLGHGLGGFFLLREGVGGVEVHVLGGRLRLLLLLLLLELEEAVADQLWLQLKVDLLPLLLLLLLLLLDEELVLLLLLLLLL